MCSFGVLWEKLVVTDGVVIYVGFLFYIDFNIWSFLRNVLWHDLKNKFEFIVGTFILL